MVARFDQELATETELTTTGTVSGKPGIIHTLEHS